MNFRHFLTGTLTLALTLVTANVWAEHAEMNPPISKSSNLAILLRFHVYLGSIYLRSQNDPDDIIWDRIPTYSTPFIACATSASIGCFTL